MDHSSSTTPSLRSSTVDEKKFESLGGATSVLPVVDDNPLYTIDEKDQDEALKLAGAERQVFTQEEMDAVKKKIDRRVIPLLAAVYFVSVPSILSLHIRQLADNVVFVDSHNSVSSSFSSASNPESLRLNFRFSFSCSRQEQSQLLFSHGSTYQR